MGQLSPARFRDQLRLLGKHTPYSFPERSVPVEWRRAALLIPFWEAEGDVYVALIRRARSLRAQPGQVVFAGGIVDPGESWSEAAVREASEEIGLDPSCVEVVGRLDDAWSGYGHHIVPVVAWLSKRPTLRANPAEVDEIFEVSVSELLRPEARSVEELPYAEQTYTNVTLRWRGGQVDKLQAELLLEALDWAYGAHPSPGPRRLESMLVRHPTE